MHFFKITEKGKGYSVKYVKLVIISGKNVYTVRHIKLALVVNKNNVNHIKQVKLGVAKEEQWLLSRTFIASFKSRKKQMLSYKT